MTRKDYVLIARAIAGANAIDYGEESTELFAVQGIVERIADALAADNPRFDRERFLKAAGVKD